MKIGIGKTKFTLQKKVLAFCGIIPLMLATHWIPVDCPTCDGVGVISGRGMEHVTIIENPITTRLSAESIVCGAYVLYTLQTLVVLQNDGDKDANGLVELRMSDRVSGYHEPWEKLAIVECEAGKQHEQLITSQWAIAVEHDKAKLPTISVTILNDDIPCPACKGTLNVPLNKWMFHNNLKGLHAVTSLARMIPPYEPGDYYVEEEGGWDPDVDVSDPDQAFPGIPPWITEDPEEDPVDN